VTVVDVNVTVPVELLAMAVPPLPPVNVLDVAVIVPVDALPIAEKVPPVTVLEVKVIVPVKLLIMVFAPLPPVTALDVTVTVPVEALLIANPSAPLPPVSVLAFEKATVPAADVDSIACAPFAIVVPTTLPPIATMPLSVNVPLDENAIARVERVNAEPVAWHPASVEVAAAETVKQFAEPAWMYAPVML
jgi:hypothetical protein